MFDGVQKMSGSEFRDLLLAIILVADVMVFGLMLWRWLSSAPVMAFVTQRGNALASTVQTRSAAVIARQRFSRHLAHG